MMRGTDTGASRRWSADESRTAEPPVFFAPCGEIRGVREDGVVRARGIRYAQAERFGPPVAEERAGETIDAYKPAPACLQPDQDPGILEIAFIAGLPKSEDCLQLSVTAPDDAAGKHSPVKPVLVWIHGGGYSSGAGDAAAYDPTWLVRENNVIVVSVTYRLGPLGYCGSHNRPWNPGLLDQREALRWVQRNIRAFGGDPECVTVMGESAGADSILHLMAAEGVIDTNRPLFRRAIVQSAPVGSLGHRPGVADALGPVVDALPSEGPLGSLTAVDRRVRQAARAGSVGGTMPYSVEYGYPPLPAAESAAARLDGIAPTVDLLIGTNCREAAMFLGSPPFRRLRAVPAVGAGLAESATRLLTVAMFERPLTRFLRRYREAGGRAVRYRFLGGQSGTVLRAAHIAELPYLFPNAVWEESAFIAPSTWERVAEVGAPMRRVWAEFARDGAAAVENAPVDPEESDCGLIDFNADLQG